MENKFFLHQIRTKMENGAKVFDKGIAVKDTFEAAKQSYHAYMGAYGYGNAEGTDFVSCMITDMSGMVLMAETWNAPAQAE